MAGIAKEFEPILGNAGRPWLKSEDYWAIWLGLTLLVVGLFIPMMHIVSPRCGRPSHSI
jgi:hypothetical protein